MLKHARLGEFDNRVLVELAVSSNLAPVFGEHGKRRHGLAGLLSIKDGLERFATTFKNVPAPLILAPNPSVTEATMESAVALLGTIEGPYDQATLLVHVNDAPKFANTYHYVDRFDILWDTADLPNAALQQLTQVLVENHCVSKDRWGAFRLCRHPYRPLADAAERKVALQEILQEFPLLYAA